MPKKSAKLCENFDLFYILFFKNLLQKKKKRVTILKYMKLSVLRTLSGAIRHSSVIMP